MLEIETRNCQVVKIPLKTHTIILASKEDIPNVEKVINDFFNKFEVLKITPLVKSGELIKPIVEERSSQKKVTDNKKSSVLSQYLQIKEMLKESFTANEYHEALCTITSVNLQSVYHHLNTLVKSGKLLVVLGSYPTKYSKVHKEFEPIDLKKDQNALIGTFK